MGLRGIPQRIYVAEVEHAAGAGGVAVQRRAAGPKARERTAVSQGSFSGCHALMRPPRAAKLPLFHADHLPSLSEPCL